MSNMHAPTSRTNPAPICGNTDPDAETSVYPTKITCLACQRKPIRELLAGWK